MQRDHTCLCLSYSHLQKTKGGREGRPDVLLHDPQRNGVRHQKWTFPGAWRVRREPLRHQDQLHTRGDRNSKDLHPGRQPTGRGSFTYVLPLSLCLCSSPMKTSIHFFVLQCIQTNYVQLVASEVFSG